MATPIEELERKLGILEDGGEKLAVLCEISEVYHNTEPSRSIAAAEEAYALAVRLGDPASLVQGLEAIGRAKTLVDRDGALAHLQEAVRILDGIDYPVDQQVSNATYRFSLLSNMASIYEHTNRWSESLVLQQEALDLALQQKNSLQQRITHANMASLYIKMGHAEPALQQATRALTLSQQRNDLHSCMHARLMLGSVYGELLNDHRRAIEYFRDALHIADRHGYLPVGPLLLVNIAEAYMQLGNVDEAVGYLERAEARLRPLHYMDVLVHCLSMRGKNEMLRGDMQRAERYLREALSLADELKDKHLQYRIYELLAQCYRQRGEFEKALDHYEQFHRIREEIFNEESQSKIQALTVQYDVERARSEKELAEKEREIVRLKNEELSSALEEVRSLNSRLVELNNEKNEMLGIVAHDLKSPLSGIRMVSALLKQHYRKMSGDELLRQLEDIEQTSGRMLQIANNLLNVHAIESNTVYTVEENIDASAEIALIVQSYMAEAERKGIVLQCESGGQLWLQASREALHQVVGNLISNALKFSSTGKSVWVRVRQSDEKITIEVEDEGPGIDPADQQKLFEKYGRLSARPTGGEVSTGLGLWIVRRSVDVLRGRIHCHSEAGGGTRFVVEVPLYTQCHQANELEL